MAATPWFRVLLNRLAFFMKPIPLVSSVFVVLLAVFIWEYRSHPEWFGAFSQEETGPNENIDLSGLTPEEQAAAADIDNLELLLNDLNAQTAGQPVIQAEGVAEETLSLQAILGALQGTEGQTTSESNLPFGEYLQQYQFSGGSTQGSPQATSSSLDLLNTLLASPSSDADTPVPPTALQQALQNQEAARLNSDRASGTESDETNEVRSLGNNEPRQLTPAGAELLGTEEPGLTGINPLSVPFYASPTLPQQSPPPGTTGYTPPASLGLTQPTGTSTGAGTVPLTPSAAGVPSVPSAASSNLNLGVPNVDVSGGSLVPYTPLPSAIQPIPAPITSPSGVPRAPGSYIGGGYINTFSNPSAIPEQ
ncbi:MAG: hypothetical protein AAFX01_03540 [Cyanobacteria bacterium J06638_28]